MTTPAADKHQAKGAAKPEAKQPAGTNGHVSDAQPAAHAQPVAQEPTGKFRLDTSDLKSSYCNVCNASSTREEVVLSLGINNNWELERGGEMEIKLLHRIILSPFAAERLSEMLNNLMRDHEARHGALR